MNHATILYQTGSADLGDQDPAAGIRAAGLDPRWTEWAAGGPTSVNDALLRLATRGAHRVEAVSATLTVCGAVDLGGARVRLFG